MFVFGQYSLGDQAQSFVDSGVDLYKSTTFFFHFFLSFLFSSYQEYFWLKVVILKLSERHSKMLENNCEDRLKN